MLLLSGSLFVLIQWYRGRAYIHLNRSTEVGPTIGLGPGAFACLRITVHNESIYFLTIITLTVFVLLARMAYLYSGIESY